MLPMRKCRMRQLLNAATTADETDRIPPSSIKTIKNVLKDLKAIDDESNGEERIKHVDETFMDAHIYHTASHVAYKCIEGVDYTQHCFNPDEFTDRLINFMSNHQPDDYSMEQLDAIADVVDLNKFMPRLFSYASIYGGLSNRPEPPPRVRRQREVAQAAEKKQLIKVVDAEQASDKTTDDTLKFLAKVLTDAYKKTGNSPVDYYKFVIDTSDFGKTVENIFYTSFSLNDGKIKMLIDEGVPKLAPLDKKSRVDPSQADASKKTQLVTSITMAMWQEHCEGIQEGILQQYRGNEASASK